LHITVEDNGKGFDTEATGLKKGVGLLSIRSRVAYLNGQFDISSIPGKGTMITIECKLQS
jgi:two-component system NarL family sensor kinase